MYKKGHLMHKQNKKYKLISHACISSLMLLAASSQAAQIEVSVRNVNSNIYFTPMIVAASPPLQGTFRSGVPATPELKTLAETGNATPLLNALNAATATAVIATYPSVAPVGFLRPNSNATATLTTTAQQTHLSIAAMILPSNDGFVGVSSWPIPTTPGVYSFDIDAWDSGTKRNDELSTNMPNPAFLNLGTGGTGMTMEIKNSHVHIHRGNVGDFQTQGGLSDINAGTQRWVNPVARVTVTVM